MGTVTPVSAGSAPVSEHRRRGPGSGPVLVLNATYEPINVCSVRRAAVLLLKEKAEVVERASWSLRSEHTAMPRPVVIRLLSYVRVPRDPHKRRITRRAVFARDGWTCQYCGSRSNLTVDHVIPRSRGGDTSWTNVVAACLRCNLRKGNRFLDEVPMRLLREPVHPKFVFSTHMLKHPHASSLIDSWRKYLVAAL